jgi:hypothetical protein
MKKILRYPFAITLAVVPAIAFAVGLVTNVSVQTFFGRALEIMITPALWVWPLFDKWYTDLTGIYAMEKAEPWAALPIFAAGILFCSLLYGLIGFAIDLLIKWRSNNIVETTAVNGGVSR